MEDVTKAQLHPLFKSPMQHRNWFTVSETQAAKLRSNLINLSWVSFFVWVSSGPYAWSVNIRIIHNMLCQFHFVFFNMPSLYSLSERIHAVLFPSSFSVVWQLPSLAWTPHRTRVERTVSFCVHVSVCIWHDRTESEVSLPSYVCHMDKHGHRENQVQNCDISLLLLNPHVVLDLFYQWGHLLRFSWMPVLMSIISKTLCTDGLFLEGMKQTWKVLKFVLIQIRADSEFTLVSHAPRNVPSLNSDWVIKMLLWCLLTSALISLPCNYSISHHVSIRIFKITLIFCLAISGEILTSVKWRPVWVVTLSWSIWSCKISERW